MKKRVNDPLGSHRLLMALLTCAAFGPFGCSPETPPAPVQAPDAAANTPPITLARVATVESLLRDARGKVVVLNIWATWCAPCVAEMPNFIKFYNAYKDKGVAFLSVSADDPAGADTQLRGFQRSKGIPFPIYVLEERDPDALGNVLKTELSGALPVTLLYARDGTLKKEWDNPIALEDLNAAVDGLL